MKYLHLQLKPEEFEAQVAWVKEYPWEWWVTLNIGVRDFSRVFREFMFELIKKEKLQLAYMGFFSERGGFHIHLLAMGHNRRGESLRSVDSGKWEKEWRETIHHSAKIKPVYSLDRVCEYLVEHAHDPKNEFFDYNKKLLNKRRGGVSPLYSGISPDWAGFKSTGVHV